jgi:hypothetical protein
MNEIITADYFPGQDCDCEARSSYECGCDADWTPVEVYQLREDAKQLADRLTALELHSTSELARLEQELADAREEAHRFRSLYYAKSGINKSASAFPWEDAK